MLKVVFHKRFFETYCADPASAPGRMEAIVEHLEGRVQWVDAQPAEEAGILAVHSPLRLQNVKTAGLFDVAALAAGGAIQAASLGMDKPAFGLIRPPGHHASRDSAWGFCYFNNMAAAIENLHRGGRIEKAFVLDIDLHYGDGTMNILGNKKYVKIANPGAGTRSDYLGEVKQTLPSSGVDVIAISAGFDHHVEDWGGLLETSDYLEIGRLAALASRRAGAGLFALLEGGYNHQVLGQNVLALIHGMEEGWET